LRTKGPDGVIFLGVCSVAHVNDGVERGGPYGKEAKRNPPVLTGLKNSVGYPGDALVAAHPGAGPPRFYGGSTQIAKTNRGQNKRQRICGKRLRPQTSRTFLSGKLLLTREMGWRSTPRFGEKEENDEPPNNAAVNYLNPRRLREVHLAASVINFLPLPPPIPVPSRLTLRFAK